MTITKVEQKPSGWFIVTDSTGLEHATKSEWLASLAQRHMERGDEVTVLSFAGWRYRELRNLTQVKQKESCA